MHISAQHVRWPASCLEADMCSASVTQGSLPSEGFNLLISFTTGRTTASSVETALPTPHQPRAHACASKGAYTDTYRQRRRLVVPMDFTGIPTRRAFPGCVLCAIAILLGGSALPTQSLFHLVLHTVNLGGMVGQSGSCFECLGFHSWPTIAYVKASLAAPVRRSNVNWCMISWVRICTCFIVSVSKVTLWDVIMQSIMQSINVECNVTGLRRRPCLRMLVVSNQSNHHLCVMHLGAGAASDGRDHAD